MAQNYTKDTIKGKAKKKSTLIKRSTTYTVRLTLTERAKIERKARQCGMKTSAFIRACCLGYEPKARFTTEEATWMKNLVAIRNDFSKFANAFSKKSKAEKTVLFQRFSFFLQWYKELFPLTDALTKYLQFLRQTNRFMPSTTNTTNENKKI